MKYIYSFLGLSLYVSIYVLGTIFWPKEQWLLILFPILLSFVQLLSGLIQMMVTGSDEFMSHIWGYCFPFIFFLKRIYYKDLKNIYILKRGNTYHVFQITPLYVKHMCEVSTYGDDMEDHIKSMKKEIDNVFKEQILKDEKDKVYKNWDGCLDEYSRRSNELNKLI